MTSQALTTPACGSLSSKIKTLFIPSGLLSLFMVMICQSTLAQTIQPRPVARLISSNEGEHSRPRRAMVREESSLNAHASSSASPSIDEATRFERRAFERTNEMRIAQGLNSLTWDSDLCRLARKHSESMAQQGYFSHETREGLQLTDRARVGGIPRFRAIGENIAYNKGYEDAGGFAVERWMKSPGHRANILYIGFQASAIGSYVSTDGSVYLTQILIAR